MKKADVKNALARLNKLYNKIDKLEQDATFYVNDYEIDSASSFIIDRLELVKERIETVKSLLEDKAFKQKKLPILKTFEDLGFDVSKEGKQYFIHQYTPAGEDWGFYLEKLHDVIEYAQNFDVDEEFKMWLDAKQNGVRGVPEASELWQDQCWKRGILVRLANRI